MVARLFQIGHAFDALMAEYRAARANLAALEAECDRISANAGVVYGSSAWASRRHAACGHAVQTVNRLFCALEDIAAEIATHPARSLPCLLVKAKAHAFTGTPADIIPEIEALLKEAA